MKKLDPRNISTILCCGVDMDMNISIMWSVMITSLWLSCFSIWRDIQPPRKRPTRGMTFLLCSCVYCVCACDEQSIQEMLRKACKATATTQQKDKEIQHNLPETVVIFQRKIGCLGWDEPISM